MKKKPYKNVICLYRDEFAILTVYPKQIDLDELCNSYQRSLAMTWGLSFFKFLFTSIYVRMINVGKYTRVRE